MAKQDNSIKELLRKFETLDGKIINSFVGFQKLSDKDREGKIFFGELLEKPNEQKPKGFDTPCQIAKFAEFDNSDFANQLHEVSLICTVDLVAKLNACEIGDKLAIIISGEKKIKNKPQPMIEYIVKKM